MSQAARVPVAAVRPGAWSGRVPVAVGDPDATAECQSVVATDSAIWTTSQGLARFAGIGRVARWDLTGMGVDVFSVAPDGAVWVGAVWVGGPRVARLGEGLPES